MPSKKTLSVREATRYPLFKIPLIGFIICLILAGACGFLGFGKPQVNVLIALDLSGSTYYNRLENIEQSDTILAQEINAVNAYLDYNQQKLKHPNQVQVFGFGGNVKPLTTDFSNNTQTLKTQFNQAIAKANLTNLISNFIQPEHTDINLAIEMGTKALSQVSKGCRELLLVTDGEADISPNIIKNAAFNDVKLNVVLVGDESSTLRRAANSTGGIYLSGTAQTLDQLFTQQLFIRFNSNLHWIVFWLGCAWSFLMWMLCLPLERFIFKRVMGLNFHRASQLALANALFWTVLTPCIVWGVAGRIPFLSGC